MGAGFRVGRQLAERYTANRARLGEPLEVIKFICKEFWAAAFRKQVCGIIRPHMRQPCHLPCVPNICKHPLSHSKVHERHPCCLQVDNLRTNHRGTFVLKDAAFRWLSKLSVDPLPPGVPSGSSPVAELARDYLILPCALIRGALVHLGVESTVTADASNLPACDFTINIKSRN